MDNEIGGRSASGSDEIRNSVGALPLESEFRLDPVAGTWTLIVEGRDARPSNTECRFVRVVDEDYDTNETRKDCVFCPGNEKHTPEVVFTAMLKESVKSKEDFTLDDVDFCFPSKSEEDTDRKWLVRCVENKYPAFRMNPGAGAPLSFDEIEERFFQGSASTDVRFFNSYPGVGRHEVIVDSRRHTRSWSSLTDSEIKLAFRVFRARLSVFRESGQFAYSFVFKNVGPGAGASQLHSHCQLTGNVELPPYVRYEIERLISYERSRLSRGEKATYWDAVLSAELAAQVRVVTFTERFVVYCPYASRFPMQTEICPRFSGAFESYDDATTDELALLARRTIAALEAAKRVYRPNDPSPLDHNVVLRNAPTRLDGVLSEGADLARPRWQILPSIVKKAGYEIGSGVDINPIAPETAARYLRETFTSCLEP